MVDSIKNSQDSDAPTNTSPGKPCAGDALRLGILVGLTGLALLWIFFSSQWRMQHDTPLMYYAALLMDRFDLIPYRDFFETSFPGTFLVHLGLAYALGYSDSSFALFGVLHLGLIMLFSALFMRPFGKWVALAAPVLFALLYISHGPSMILQRDYLVLLPVTTALFLAGRNQSGQSHWPISLAVGLLFGLAGAIKPQMILGAVPVWIYLATTYSDKARGKESGQKRNIPWSELLRVGMGMGAGGLLIFVPMFLWLWRAGGLPAFWSMFNDYLPLHLALTGSHTLIDGTAYLLYFIKNYIKLDGYVYLLPLAILASWLTWQQNPTQRPRLMMIFGILGMYTLIPGMAGQFWPYHWMPFVLPLSLLLGLLFAPFHEPNRLLPIASLLLLPALWFAAPPNWELRLQMQGRDVPPPLQGRADEIATYLRDHLQPGDTVQPLDWTAGAIHGMLQAKAPLATRFLYDYHFYHHPGHPVIKALRDEFMRTLTAAQPRFVIDVDHPYHPKSFDNAPEFTRLQTWLQVNYRVVHQGTNYRILERKRNPSGDATQ